MPCPGQPAIAPWEAPLCTGSQTLMMLAKGQRHRLGKGLIAVSGSQAASLKLEGAGQDALSVNTWSWSCLTSWCFFFFFCVAGCVCTHIDTHAQLHLRGAFGYVVCKG